MKVLVLLSLLLTSAYAEDKVLYQCFDLFEGHTYTLDKEEGSILVTNTEFGDLLKSLTDLYVEPDAYSGRHTLDFYTEKGGERLFMLAMSWGYPSVGFSYVLERQVENLLSNCSLKVIKN